MSLDISLYIDVDTGGSEPVKLEVFTANITHNLNKMAMECDLYKVMWRPEEIDIEYAGDAVKILESGIAKLESNPDHYRQFNPPNGWGDYENLLKVSKSYLEACKKHPKCKINAYR